MKRSCIDDLLIVEGLRWRQYKTLFGELVDPEFAEQWGESSSSTSPLRREASSVLTRWVRKRQRTCRLTPPINVTKRPAQQATLELDYGQRGKGYVFGSFQLETGATFIWTDLWRTTTHFVTFLEETETWIDPWVARVYAFLDNLQVPGVVSTCH